MAEGGRPHLRVVRGEPTAEELAALVTVLTARAAVANRTGRQRKTRSEWANPARSVRGPLRPGLSAWRRSGLPR